jgi:hypothetical protein
LINRRFEYIPKTIIGRDHLKALLVFSNIQTLSLYPDCEFDLSDKAVMDMALAWPCLRSLILDGFPLKTFRVTISGLIPFAQHCHELHLLSIAFDARTATRPAPDPQGFHSTALKWLDVQTSPISNPL